MNCHQVQHLHGNVKTPATPSGAAALVHNSLRLSERVRVQEPGWGCLPMEDKKPRRSCLRTGASWSSRFVACGACTRRRCCIESTWHLLVTPAAMGWMPRPVGPAVGAATRDWRFHWNGFIVGGVHASGVGRCSRMFSLSPLVHVLSVPSPPCPCAAATQTPLAVYRDTVYRQPRVRWSQHLPCNIVTSRSYLKCLWFE